MSGWLLAAAAPASAIPFRQEAATGGAASLSGALLIAVAMLSVVAAAAWYARRRGWLDRWVGPAPSPRAQTLRVEQTLRLSPQTTLYRVVHEGEVLLVVESRVNARIERTSLDGGGANEA
ncbi:MAG TPA: hypothetical protein VGD42_01875 [Lysobacter sp.]